MRQGQGRQRPLLVGPFAAIVGEAIRAAHQKADVPAILLPVLQLRRKLFGRPRPPTNLQRDDPVFRAGGRQNGVTFSLHQPGDIGILAPMGDGDFNQFHG